jgi:hypothetical protein
MEHHVVRFLQQVAQTGSSDGFNEVSSGGCSWLIVSLKNNFSLS